MEPIPTRTPSVQAIERVALLLRIVGAESVRSVGVSGFVIAICTASYPMRESSMPVFDHWPHLLERSLEATTVKYIEMLPGHVVWMRNVSAPFDTGINLF